MKNLKNPPQHYGKLEIQPVNILNYVLATGNVFNVIKYLSRFNSKNGYEDLLKAIDYLSWLEEERENKHLSYSSTIQDVLSRDPSALDMFNKFLEQKEIQRVSTIFLNVVALQNSNKFFSDSVEERYEKLSKSIYVKTIELIDELSLEFYQKSILQEDREAIKKFKLFKNKVLNYV